MQTGMLRGCAGRIGSVDPCRNGLGSTWMWTTRFQASNMWTTAIAILRGRCGRRVLNHAAPRCHQRLCSSPDTPDVTHELARLRPRSPFRADRISRFREGSIPLGSRCAFSAGCPIIGHQQRGLLEIEADAVSYLFDDIRVSGQLDWEEQGADHDSGSALFNDIHALTGLAPSEPILVRVSAPEAEGLPSEMSPQAQRPSRNLEAARLQNQLDHRHCAERKRQGQIPKRKGMFWGLRRRRQACLTGFPSTCGLQPRQSREVIGGHRQDEGIPPARAV